MSAATWSTPRSSSLNPNRGQRRKSPRRTVHLTALIMAERGGPLLCQCTMIDVSEGGARLKLEDPAKIPEFFRLVLSRGARIHRSCQVRWRSETEIGVQFRSD
jgi:PilZ domain